MLAGDRKNEEWSGRVRFTSPVLVEWNIFNATDKRNKHNLPQMLLREEGLELKRN